MSKKQPDLAAHAKALHAAINGLPDAEKDYLLNFVTKNAHRPLAEMLERMAADRAGREEAEAIQRHREERVLDEYREIMKRKGVEVSITGVAVDGSSESVQAKG